MYVNNVIKAIQAKWNNTKANRFPAICFKNKMAFIAQPYYYCKTCNSEDKSDQIWLPYFPSVISAL